MWDSAVRPRETATPARRSPATPGQRASSDVDQGLASPVKRVVDAVTRIAPDMETAVFILMFVAMVGFFIDWALRIAGVK